MSLNNDEVEKIAHLARLKVSDEEVEQYRAELSNILDLVEQLNKVDTKDVAPMAHPFEVGQRLREDDVTEENQRESYQSCAQAVENGLFLVPKVIE